MHLHGLVKEGGENESVKGSISRMRDEARKIETMSEETRKLVIRYKHKKVLDTWE